MKIEKKQQQTTTKVCVTITGEDIRQRFGLPEGTTIHVNMPRGAAWDGADLIIGESYPVYAVFEWEGDGRDGVRDAPYDYRAFEMAE